MALSTLGELSASTYGGATLEEAVGVFVAAGVRHVEIAIGPRWSPATRDALRGWARDGVSFSGHHAFPLETRGGPFDLCERWSPSDLSARLDLLAKLGATRYSVHAGGYSDGDHAAALVRFVEGFLVLRELAASRGVTLGIETMYPLRHGPRRYLAANLTSVRELAGALPGVPWVLDLAHVGLWGNDARVPALTALRALPLLEVHVSDNDGRSDTHAPIREDTWWLEHSAGLGEGVPWVLESRMVRRGATAVSVELARVRALDPVRLLHRRRAARATT